MSHTEVQTHFMTLQCVVYALFCPLVECVCVYMCICVCVCECICVCACACACVYVCVRARVCVCVCVCMCVSTWFCACVYVSVVSCAKPRPSCLSNVRGYCVSVWVGSFESVCAPSQETCNIIHLCCGARCAV